MSDFGDTVDPDDIDRFAAQSADWWDTQGSFRPLHQLNPTRIDFICRHLVAHFRRDPRSLAPF
ncbi:MAG TPA: bifunctional 3-demethylubiquinol 3-O-methyltransferase/2-polyprenyl-6-hydroxyphenol methylase, partial [Stellaceae bacterium]|nr:bifunctional 3-demethylubiquinol 3-O-methyltransferase/2-polyprenyl-6-hydroxyphenol methylase [Stellaceae bacterium]